MYGWHFPSGFGKESVILKGREKEETKEKRLFLAALFLNLGFLATKYIAFESCCSYNAPLHYHDDWKA